LLVLSCEDKAEWDLETAESFPVVDCILTNEMKYQELRISWSQSDMNETPVGIEGVTIIVSDGINRFQFSDETGEPGKYRSDMPFMAVAGARYRLTLAKDGIVDTAYAEMVGVEPLDSLTLAQSDSLFRFNYQTGGTPSMTEVWYDWQMVPDFVTAYGAEQAMEAYYTLTNIDAGKEFAPAREIIWFPKQTTIVRRKYSLSAEHQEFIRSLLLETEWRGGFFDVEPGNVPTNFSHGTRGWFAVCAVTTDTTLVE
jgi:hypothetical protein